MIFNLTTLFKHQGLHHSIHKKIHTINGNSEIIQIKIFTDEIFTVIQRHLDDAAEIDDELAVFIREQPCTSIFSHFNHVFNNLCMYGILIIYTR